MRWAAELQRTSLGFILLAGLAACNRGQPCPADRANDGLGGECHDGAECLCDAQGRVLSEERDANGDGRVDRVSYRRDERGLVVVIETDFGDNGSVEREQRFSYDADGRRVANEGWLAKCGGEKFRWSCRYDAPCAAPFAECPACRNQYEIEQKNGSLKPCGKPKP